MKNAQTLPRHIGAESYAYYKVLLNSKVYYYIQSYKTFRIVMKSLKRSWKERETPLKSLKLSS